MRFKILHTNDVHSRFENFAKLTTKIKELKDENTLVLDAGDYHDFKDVMLQGTSGKAGRELLLEAGYEAIAIGNNEAFEGLDTLGFMVKNDCLPFLSCNLVKLDGSMILGVKRSIIVTKSGVRFLIIGTSPNFKIFLHLLGMNTLDYKEQIQKELSDNKGKYDICILLSHLGLIEDTDIANTMEGIDIIIDGHSHELMAEPRVIKNTVVHMSGCYGENLGLLEFEYNGNISEINGININIKDVEMDENIIKIIEKNKKTANDNLGLPLYSIDRDMWHDVVEENPITNLLADAVRDVLNCDIGLINSGIINSGIRKGEVSFKKLIEICPSPLNPTYMEIQGKYIKKALEQSLDPEFCYKDGAGSGFRGRFLGRLHISGALIEHDGNKINKIIINGKELDEEKYYSVATSDYLQRGTGYRDLANNINVRYNVEYLRITLRDYLYKNNFLDNSYIDRWIKK
ncbi:bifunctional UDP-sugar hydrolase/5'-nucleotidase [Clostridium nigeriense]|uniref:bifunctional metallophosphatase/5'-nucleotidase n=1 Tax=Clostridium nigeriense TaxID=1805470 RepID=UPI00082AE955|nr:5'-nucleotidase C-terminal domain-containing protein [Clostridium nigeriense]